MQHEELLILGRIAYIAILQGPSQLIAIPSEICWLLGLIGNLQRLRIKWGK